MTAKSILWSHRKVHEPSCTSDTSKRTAQSQMNKPFLLPHLENQKTAPSESFQILTQTKIKSSFKDGSCPRSSESVDLKSPRTLKSRTIQGEREQAHAAMLSSELPEEAETSSCACCISLGLCSAFRKGQALTFTQVAVHQCATFPILPHWEGKLSTPVIRAQVIP